jgi:apolipoprotein N-acyltransferase
MLRKDSRLRELIISKSGGGRQGKAPVSAIAQPPSLPVACPLKSPAFFLTMGVVKKKDVFLSIIAGLLLVFSFPNFDLEFLAWFALVPLFLALEGKSLLHSFISGFITGFVSFLGILYWIIVAVHTYGNVPLLLSGPILLLLVAYLSLFIGTFTSLFHFLQKRTSLPMLVLAPCLWVSLEYLRSFFLTGFPWANLGYSQYLNLPFVQVADITGVYGLSFAILLVNVTLYLILNRWPRRQFPYREAVLTTLVLLGIFAYGYFKMSALDQRILQSPSLRVGVVQGNIDQSIKWDESFQKETLRIYERLSLKVAEGKPDLIIWPETATPFFFQEAKEYQPVVLDIPRKTDAFLLFGSPSYTIVNRRVNHYNSAYLVSKAGEIVGKYDKIHLVPFGEYVPLSDLLFFIGSLGEGIGNFKSGRDPFIFSLPQGQFGVVICFEVIFPDLCRRFVKRGANFLVTITNDAWFGKTSAPYQHFAIATLRAVENRVFVARAANTGISGFIDPKGRIINQGGIFTEEAMNEKIYLMKGRTFYTQYGDIFAWLCSALSILFLANTMIRRRKEPLGSKG